MMVMVMVMVVMMMVVVVVIYDMIYLLTAIGLLPGGRSTVHIYTQTTHRTIRNKQYIEQHNNWKSASRAPSWLVIPWHLPYNRGKSTENLSQGRIFEFKWFRDLSQ